MARPIGSISTDTTEYNDYLGNIRNVYSKRKARFVLAKLFTATSDKKLSILAIRLVCHKLADSDYSQGTIKTYLVEIAKYLAWLKNSEFINALFYYAYANNLMEQNSTIWLDLQPESLTLPIE
jgi:hypothetical protein